MTPNGRGTRPAGGTVRSLVTSLTCLLRSAPLFFRATPATPLRVLCIVALDAVHVRWHSVPLSRRRREQLALLLDFQAGTNAVWDDKPLPAPKPQTLRERLEACGLGPWIRDFLDRLHHLEAGRPALGVSIHCVDAVRAYREAVVRLSLATAVGVALGARHIDDALAAMDADDDVAALFQMAMQCQVIDDVLDYQTDRASRLPGFMTAAPLPQALASAASAVRSYDRPRTRANVMFPLRAALSVLSALAGLAVRSARWIHEDSFWNDTGSSIV